MSKYTAVIIGAGSIGALKPDEFDSPDTKNVLTIAHAVTRNKNIYLIGIHDRDENKAIKAGCKWGATSYYNQLEYLPDVDVIFIASDTSSHLDIIDAIKDKAKIIMCEKPFCSNLHDAQVADQLHLNIGVNYSRSYEPEHIKLAEHLKTKEIYSVVVKYNRGLKRDGCHAINFLNQFLGECESGNKFSYGFNDYDKDDSTGVYTFEYERCENVVFLPVPGDKISIFEIEIFAEDGRYKLVSNGYLIYKSEIVPEPTYGKYYTISLFEKAKPTRLHNMLEDMVQNVVDTLDGKSQLKCTARDAIKVHEIMEMVG